MTTQSSAWATFYEGRSGDDYLAYVKDRYAPFIGAIRDRMRLGDRVLELGCGTGTITRSLVDEDNGKQEHTFFASDRDPDMRRLARKRLRETPAGILPLDATRVPTLFAEVVHSHGMLEHFDDDTIRKIIQAHKHARVQVHYVPGLYESPTFGDERLMPVQQWVEICDPTEVITFNDGLDYALIWEPS